MSVNLSIKEVPEHLAAQLRSRAARNHRSLQGELMAIIEQAALAFEPEHSASPPQTSGAMRQGWKTIEQIAAEHRALYPEPFRDLPLAVDIIRADRDAR